MTERVEKVGFTISAVSTLLTISPMIRMTVEGVGFDHLQQPVVLLRDWEGARLLPIWIGPPEARAIQVEIEGAQSPRPLSHDLLLTLIATLKGRVSRVVIVDLIDSTFYAQIDIDTPRGTKQIDARPSDAIALAVRARCPIFVDGTALDALVESGEPLPGQAEILGSSEDLTSSEEDETENDDEIDRFKRLLGE